MAAAVGGVSGKRQIVSAGAGAGLAELPVFLDRPEYWGSCFRTMPISNEDQRNNILRIGFDNKVTISGEGNNCFLFSSLTATLMHIFFSLDVSDDEYSITVLDRLEMLKDRLIAQLNPQRDLAIDRWIQEIIAEHETALGITGLSKTEKQSIEAEIAYLKQFQVFSSLLTQEDLELFFVHLKTIVLEENNIDRLHDFLRANHSLDIALASRMRYVLADNFYAYAIGAKEFPEGFNEELKPSFIEIYSRPLSEGAGASAEGGFAAAVDASAAREFSDTGREKLLEILHLNCMQDPEVYLLPSILGSTINIFSMQAADKLHFQQAKCEEVGSYTVSLKLEGLHYEVLYADQHVDDPTLERQRIFLDTIQKLHHLSEHSFSSLYPSSEGYVRELQRDNLEQKIKDFASLIITLPDRFNAEEIALLGEFLADIKPVDLTEDALAMHIASFADETPCSDAEIAALQEQRRVLVERCEGELAIVSAFINDELLRRVRIDEARVNRLSTRVLSDFTRAQAAHRAITERSSKEDDEIQLKVIVERIRSIRNAQSTWQALTGRIATNYGDILFDEMRPIVARMRTALEEMQTRLDELDADHPADMARVESKPKGWLATVSSWF